jgi:predicted dithiol-disulfide oxidoreductase (DUF899 family)
MYDPEWEDACPSCSAGLDEMSAGLLRNMRARDTAFATVSRAPYAKIAAYKKRRGWDFEWYSSFGSDFNYDFHVSIDSSVTPVMFNYRDEAELKASGFSWILDGPSAAWRDCFRRTATGYHLLTPGRSVEQFGAGVRVPRHHGARPPGSGEEPKGRVPKARKAIPDFAE